MRQGRALARRLLDERRPTLAICLGHQLLCAELGLELHRRPTPNQGAQIPVGLFGRTQALGFYNSFAVLAPAPAASTRHWELAHDGPELAALRGPGFAGLQFHPESVLTRDGLGILRRELVRLLTEDGDR
jgi:phenazine biosynthesis protein phzE